MIVVQLGKEKGVLYLFFKHYDTNLKLIKEAKFHPNLSFNDFTLTTNTDSDKVYCLKNYTGGLELHTHEFSLNDGKVKYYKTATPKAFTLKDVIVHKDNMYLANNIFLKGKKMLVCCFLQRQTTYSYYTRSEIWKINLNSNSLQELNVPSEGIEFKSFIYQPETKTILVPAIEKVVGKPIQISHASVFEIKDNRLNKIYEIQSKPRNEYKLESFTIIKTKSNEILGLLAYSDTKKPVEATTKIVDEGIYIFNNTSRSIDANTLISIGKDKYEKLLDIYQGSLYTTEEFNDGKNKSGKELNVSEYKEIFKKRILGQELRIQCYIRSVEILPDRSFILKTKSINEVNGGYNSPTNEKAAQYDINYYSYCKIDKDGKMIWKKDIKDNDVDIHISPLQFDPSVYLYTQNAKSFTYAFMKNDELPTDFMSVKLTTDVQKDEEVFSTSKTFFLEWYEDYAAILVYQTNVPKKNIEKFKKIKAEADKGSIKAMKELEDETLTRGFFVLAKAKINL